MFAGSFTVSGRITFRRRCQVDPIAPSIWVDTNSSIENYNKSNIVAFLILIYR